MLRSGRMSALHPRGVLVAFDGIDGAGKTTQARRRSDAPASHPV